MARFKLIVSNGLVGGDREGEFEVEDADLAGRDDDRQSEIIQEAAIEAAWSAGFIEVSWERAE